MTTSLMPEPRQRYFDSNGQPLAGGLVYTYAAGTNTPKQTFTDSAGTTPSANPIVLDVNGEALIFWSGAYRINVTSSLDVQIGGYPVDNYNSVDNQIATAVSASESTTNLAISNLNNALQIPDYAALRAYAGTRNMVYVTGYDVANDPSGIAGAFIRNTSDTTSADNSGTKIVSASGVRWDRVIDGPVSCKVFQVKGDGVQDDTAALQRWIDWLTSQGTTKQHAGYWPSGTYKVTGAGLVVTVGDTLPPMLTDGAENVIVKGEIPVLITFQPLSGSGQQMGVTWEGVRLDGVSLVAGRDGVRNDGLCFFTLKGWHFYNLDNSSRPYNLTAGRFTEGWVLEDCYFHTNVNHAMHFSRGAGNDSFRSTGLKNCKINIGATAQPILIDAGCVPYMMPCDVTFWNFNSDCQFIVNNSTQIQIVGDLTTETQNRTDQTGNQGRDNKMTLVSLASAFYVFHIGDIIAWNYNSDKFLKGKLFSIREYFNAPDIGQLYLPENFSGSFTSTVVGETFSVPYSPGVNPTFQSNAAIMTICVTGPGYRWQGQFMVRTGLTDNIVNASPIIGADLILNTAGYGAMVVSQGNAFNVLVSNPSTAIGTKLSFSMNYQHGLIPNI